MRQDPPKELYFPKSYTIEQMIDDIKAARSVEDDARNRMTVHNARHILYTVKAMVGRGLPLVDLIQSGQIGLAIGIEKFNPKYQVHPLTYLTLEIKRSAKERIPQLL